MKCTCPGNIRYGRGLCEPTLPPADILSFCNSDLLCHCYSAYPLAFSLDLETYSHVVIQSVTFEYNTIDWRKRRDLPRDICASKGICSENRALTANFRCTEPSWHRKSSPFHYQQLKARAERLTFLDDTDLDATIWGSDKTWKAN